MGRCTDGRSVGLETGGDRVFGRRMPITESLRKPGLVTRRLRKFSHYSEEYSTCLRRPEELEARSFARLACVQTDWRISRLLEAMRNAKSHDLRKC